MELQEKLMEMSQYVTICEHKSYYNKHLKAKGKFPSSNCQIFEDKLATGLTCMMNMGLITFKHLKILMNLLL